VRDDAQRPLPGLVEGLQRFGRLHVRTLAVGRVGFDKINHRVHEYAVHVRATTLVR
jgi:hypothetical protein